MAPKSVGQAASTKIDFGSPFGLFAVLLFIRVINALSIKTFFQPDEYFQSLEPAWQAAFGGSSGAWITWVSLNVRRAVFWLIISVGMARTSSLVYSSSVVCSGV